MKTVSQYFEDIRFLPKSDLHSHAGRGGSIAYLSNYYQADIHPPVRNFANLSEMQGWFDANIKVHCTGIAGYLKRIEAAFVQAHDDSIQLLSMSFGKDEIDYLGGMEPFMTTINQLHDLFSPHTKFLPELALDREQTEAEILGWLDEIFACGWFQSIDLCNDELAQPIKRFAKVYRQAAKHNVRLKAHVGEFGTADDVIEAVETLHLHEIHHGIAASGSKQVMRWLADHQIQLNLCPASNIMLGRAKDYQTNPIRTFFDYGIPVTINTDDMLIFNSSVSQEYQKLLLADVLNEKELEEIRLRGLASQMRVCS